MIIQFIVGLFPNLISAVVGLLPTFEIEIPANVFTFLPFAFFGVAYFVPIAALLPIVLLSAALDIAGLVVALIRFILGILPTWLSGGGGGG